MSTYELAGKVLLITGAARGIGFETARIAHGRGASVVLVDLDQASADEAAAKLGSRALALAADVVDLGGMEQAVSDSVDHFGKVDVVSANARITPLKTTARAIDADDWEKVVEVNVMGVWRTIRAGLPVTIRLNAARLKQLLDAMRLDKKVSGGEIKFVLAEKVGRVRWGQQVPTALIAECLQPPP